MKGRIPSVECRTRRKKIHRSARLRSRRHPGRTTGRFRRAPPLTLRPRRRFLVTMHRSRYRVGSMQYARGAAHDLDSFRFVGSKMAEVEESPEHSRRRRRSEPWCICFRHRAETAKLRRQRPALDDDAPATSRKASDTRATRGPADPSRITVRADLACSPAWSLGCRHNPVRGWWYRSPEQRATQEDREEHRCCDSGDDELHGSYLSVGGPRRLS